MGGVRGRLGKGERVRSGEGRVGHVGLGGVGTGWDWGCGER